MTISKEQIEEAFDAFDDGINALRWLLNHASESPKKQVGGLMSCFSIEDNHTSRVDDLLENLWQKREAIRTVLQDRLEYFDTMCIDEGCPHFGTEHICVSSSEAVAALFRIMTCMAQHGATYDGLRNDRKIIESALQRNDVPQEMSQYDIRKEFEKQYPNWEKYDFGRYKDRDIDLVWQGFQTACRVLKLAAPKPTGVTNE